MRKRNFSGVFHNIYRHMANIDFNMLMFLIAYWAILTIALMNVLISVIISYAVMHTRTNQHFKDEILQKQQEMQIAKLGIAVKFWY